MPATTVLAPDGTYRNDVFPFPTKVIQSVGVPANHAVIGLAKRYFMGIGPAKGGLIQMRLFILTFQALRTFCLHLKWSMKHLQLGQTVQAAAIQQAKEGFKCLSLKN